MRSKAFGFIDVALLAVLILVVIVFTVLLLNLPGSQVPPTNGSDLPPPSWNGSAKCGNGIADEGETCQNCPQDLSAAECACFSPHTTAPKLGEKFYLCSNETVTIDWLKIKLLDPTAKRIEVTTPTRSYTTTLSQGLAEPVGYWKGTVFNGFELTLEKAVQDGIALKVDYQTKDLSLPFTVANGEIIKIRNTPLKIVADVNMSSLSVTLKTDDGKSIKTLDVGDKVDMEGYTVTYLGSSDAEPILKVTRE